MPGYRATLATASVFPADDACGTRTANDNAATDSFRLIALSRVVNRALSGNGDTINKRPSSIAVRQLREIRCCGACFAGQTMTG